MTLTQVQDREASNEINIRSSTAKSSAALASQEKARKVRRRIALAVMILPTLGFVLAMVDGWNYGFSFWKIALLIFFYVITLFGVEAGFHRLLSHSAYVTPLRSIIVVLGSMAAQGPAIFWAAAHRQHHAFSDDIGDPHSPRPFSPGSKGFLKGLWHGHMGWLLKAENVDWARFAPDLLKDRRLFNLNQTYMLWVLIGLILPAILGSIFASNLSGSTGGFWIGAWEGLLWGGLARIFLVHHAVWAVNSICHIFGSRPYQCKGTATNNLWLALPSLGGAWHNNHHAFPSTADNQFAWWQFDFSGIILRLLKSVQLVSNFKKPTDSAIAARRIQTTAAHIQA